MLVEKAVTIYRKAEMEFISSFSNVSDNVINETNFYDVGYVQSKISRIQKELKRITGELEMCLKQTAGSDYEKNKSAELMKQRERLLFHMIFLASNSLGNLEDCVKLADGYQFSYMDCVAALVEYKEGRKDNAFRLLEEYFRRYGSVEEHFLANKVFGLLLAENGFYQKAVPFLTYALQFVPDDVECLNILSKCYGQLNESYKESIVDEILEIMH